MNTKELREELNGAFTKMNEMKNSFMVKRPILNGGVYMTKTKCGNPNCKCIREGKLHEVWRYYFTEDGKNKVRTLKKKDLKKYKDLTERYRKFRSARASYIQLHKRIVDLLNKLENTLVEEGEELV